MTDARGPWAAVVLSGGRARRLDGEPKHQVRVGGRTLLDRTLDAVAAASVHDTRSTQAAGARTGSPATSV
jgi:choline kinase